MKGKNTGRDGALSSLKQVSFVSRAFHSQFVDNSRTFSGMTSSVPSMRWDNLFDDLETQLEAEIGAAEREVHDDVERERQALLTLRQRLVNLTEASPLLAGDHLTDGDTLAAEDTLIDGDPVGLCLNSGLTLSATLIRIGLDWCAVDVLSPTAYSGHALVPIAAVSELELTRRQSDVSLGTPVGAESVARHAPRIAETMGWGFILRDLARRRRTLEIHCRQGIFSGTLDRVGVDHCDVAEHAADASRRVGNVRRYRVLALASISLVRIL